MMSQALDNRLPSLKNGQEYAPRNTFRDEDWEEYEKGELGADIRRQARRAVPYFDDDDEQDVAESVNLNFL